jgi:hypothetical protein
MNALSLWLIKADARRVFLCYFVLLALVITWWTWEAARPMGNETPQRQTTINTKSSPQGLGIIAFLSSELAMNTEAPQNLFGSYEQRRQSTTQRDTGETQRNTPPPPPRKPPTFNLTYKGIMERTDGKVLALIEDEDAKKSKHTRFYSAGQEVRGFKVVEIASGTLTGTGPDGASVTLKIHVPRAFEEGRK